MQRNKSHSLNSYHFDIDRREDKTLDDQSNDGETKNILRFIRTDFSNITLKYSWL